MTVKYFVFDLHSGIRVGAADGYDSGRAARSKAHKLDAIYGAVRYTVRAIEVAA